MAAPAGGLLQTVSNAWNTLVGGVSRTYNAACDLTRAGWQKLMQFEAVQKTVNFASPYFEKIKACYPDVLKFEWSTGTAVTTSLSLLAVGGILKSRQSEESRLEELVNRYEAKEKALQEKTPKESLTVQEALLCAAAKARLDELKK